MKIDSLDELESAFEEWRRRKRPVRESMPQELLARARRVTKRRGVRAVVRVTRVDRSRLFRSRPARVKAPGERSTKPNGVPGSVPSFSRLQVTVQGGQQVVALVDDAPLVGVGQGHAPALVQTVQALEGAPAK